MATRINNMEGINQIINKIILLLKKYGLFIAPALLFLLFMFLLIFSYTNTPKKQSSAGISPSPSQNETNPSGYENPSISPYPSGDNSEGLEENEKDMPLWVSENLSADDFSNLNAAQTTLPDGSTQYSYDSNTANRPNIIIVKNGVNIFQRTPMYNVSMASITANEIPDYTSKGSAFWGENAITYIFLSKGVAYVSDPDTRQVYEQMIFQPMSIDQFEQYDNDLTGQPQKPTPAP